LRDAVAEAAPATSSEVPLLECSASIDPMPFAATRPLEVAAFTPPVPERLAEEAGFCTVEEAAGAALELTLGLAACAWVAVLLALLFAVLVAPEAAVDVADFETAAVDSVEPAKLAAPAAPVLETPPAA
jgi:hypothetical protein